MPYTVNKDFKIATSLTKNKTLKKGDKLTGDESYIERLKHYKVVDELKKPEAKADNPVKENKAFKPSKKETKEDKSLKENKQSTANKEK